MTDNGDNSRAHIPRWDGNPATYPRFKEAVKIWKLGENLEVSYSVAARLVSSLSGSARRSVINLSETELFPELERHEDELLLEWRGRRNKNGIETVMLKLSTLLGAGEVVRKAQSLDDFFSSSKYDRRAGERISDWITRFDEGDTKLKEDGVDMSKLEDVLGWFFVKRARLTLERRERVIAALSTDAFPMSELRPMLIRMFPEIHFWWSVSQKDC